MHVIVFALGAIAKRLQTFFESGNRACVDRGRVDGLGTLLLIFSQMRADKLSHSAYHERQGMADGLALIGFVKPSRRIVNVGTASVVAAMNRLWKRAARCLYPVCCSSHRDFVDRAFRGVWHADLLRTEENGRAGYHEHQEGCKGRRTLTD